MTKGEFVEHRLSLMTPINDKGDEGKIKVDDMARITWQGLMTWYDMGIGHQMDQMTHYVVICGLIRPWMVTMPKKFCTPTFMVVW